MEYNVQCLPKEEFLRLWDLVLIVRDGVRMPFHWEPATVLYRVSDRQEDFSETDKPAISQPGYDGMYFHDGQVWFNRNLSFTELQDTALHELTHHEVPHEVHGPTWRKVFGTALALHLRECGDSWDEIRHAIETQVVWPYRRFRTIVDPAEQTRIGRAEIQRIVVSAIRKIPILTARGKYG